MVVSIHQPNYIPWLGYFYKISQSDIFVFLDDVQFSNGGMHNFHYIKSPQGPMRLKIPVEQHMGDLILDVKTKDHLNWKKKHLRTVEMNYKKAQFFDEVYSDYETILLADYTAISDLNIALVEFVARKFGIETTFVKSSQLNIKSTREEKVMDICKALNAEVYYSGTGAKAYQNEVDFLERGLTLKYSVFKPFEYKQMWGDFQTNVTVLDYLMNCGYDWQNILQNQN